MAENTLLQLINSAAGRLAASGGTARLDAEILLAFTLRQSRAWLRAHGDEPASLEAVESFRQLVRRREDGEPIAYLVGRREFWSLDLAVRPGVLIPRPDTETLVQAALEVGDETGSIVDLGTGTGAIALAIASERPRWYIVATEADQTALALAQHNANALGLGDRVEFLPAAIRGSQIRSYKNEGGSDSVNRDWFDALAGRKFDLIVSNPPYIAENDPHLEQGDVRFEPRTALVSGVDGLDDIRAIIAGAREHLDAGGWLLLEHGYDQGSAVADLLRAAGFGTVQHWSDLSGHTRVTGGRV